MTEVVEEVRRLIESRLREIEKEAGGLREALTSLGSGTQSGQRSKRSSGSKKPRRRKRAPRGQRRKQFLAAVKANPGSTAADLGRAIGVSTNQAYALGQRLLKEGEVRKSGKGFHVAKK